MTSSLCILAVLFTVISLVDFNSQDASAFPGGSMLQHTLAFTVQGSSSSVSENNGILGEILTAYLSSPDRKFISISGLKFNRNNESAGSKANNETIDWKIYVLYRHESDKIAVSITLTRENKFVMNHLIIVGISNTKDTEYPKIGISQLNDAIDLVSEVIEKKMKNPDVSLIGNDSAILID